MKTTRPDSNLVRFLRTMAWIGGIFSLVICLLIILNFLQLKHADPLNTQGLPALHEKLMQDPGNAELRQEIRQLDLLARKAFFTSQWQIRAGAWMLVAGLLVLIAALKTLEMITPRIPEKMAGDVQDPLLKRKDQRRWVTVSAGVIVLASLALAWFTYRTLSVLPSNSTEKLSSVKDTAGAGKQQASPADTLNTAAGGAAGDTAAGEPYPTDREILSNVCCFRGPGGAGVYHARNVPLSWDGASGKNILWKTEIPLPGYNSPIVWKDKVFLSGAKENQREVWCFDAGSGKILWTADVTKIPGSPGQSPKVTAETGFAASTMTTDGRQVYVIYANGDLAALDFQGKIAWSKSLGLPKNHYGHASSLIMYHDLLIIQYDQTGSAKVMALEGKSGKKVWETARDVKVSWASPVLVNTGTRMELLLGADPYVASYDPATGKELWKLDCLSGEVGPSLAYANGMVFSINEYSKLAAIKPGQAPVVAWEDNEYLSDVPSPVAFKEMLFAVTSYGVVVCYDASSGKKNWVKELERTVYSSPVIAAGNMYLLDKQGVMHIFAADKTLKIVGEPALGEGSVCTPAIVEGRIYIRGNKNLYCIGK